MKDKYEVWVCDQCGFGYCTLVTQSKLLPTQCGDKKPKWKGK